MDLLLADNMAVEGVPSEGEAEVDVELQGNRPPASSDKVSTADLMVPQGSGSLEKPEDDLVDKGCVENSLEPPENVFERMVSKSISNSGEDMWEEGCEPEPCSTEAPEDCYERMVWASQRSSSPLKLLPLTAEDKQAEDIDVMDYLNMEDHPPAASVLHQLPSVESDLIAGELARIEMQTSNKVSTPSSLGFSLSKSKEAEASNDTDKSSVLELISLDKDGTSNDGMSVETGEELDTSKAGCSDELQLDMRAEVELLEEQVAEMSDTLSSISVNRGNDIGDQMDKAWDLTDQEAPLATSRRVGDFDGDLEQPAQQPEVGRVGIKLESTLLLGAHTAPTAG